MLITAHKRTQSGDTIVEVLLAILVVSLILAGAFAAANRGQNLTQRTDERAAATGYLEQVTELLREEGEDPESAIYHTNGPWCYNGITGVFEDDTVCSDVLLNRYTIWAQPAPGGDPNTFMVNIRWERLGNSDGTNTIESARNYIRVYPNE